MYSSSAGQALDEDLRQALARLGAAIKFEDIIAEVAAWEHRRNAEAAQINWMFTTEKAREKLRKAYPVKES